MAEPLRITRNLDEITTRYTVFEENQVLTHDQLNHLADYLDDQDRLTRVALLGAGIVCGLRVALLDGQVAVTRGVGVTTQGDVLWVSADARFDRFKPYDKSAPVYAPFYQGEEMLPVFELVREGEEDARAEPLGHLPDLKDMAALLLMESYVKDDDLCSGTDCDNLGRDSVHTSKVLLIGKSHVAALQENLSTFDQAARSLPEVVAERPLISARASLRGLADLYRPACAAIHDQIVAAMRAGASLLPELTGADPEKWIPALEAIRDRSAGTDPGIQYYYDFLKDVAETWNAFRDLLFGDTSVCCPDLGAFPKHLLLGALEGDSAELRTGLYPSPLTSGTAGQRAHAVFLAGKLDAMVRSFRLPAAGGPIRITPSRGEDHGLEERAIPFYYAIDEALPIYRSWSHALTQRGRERSNTSYHADSYNPGAGARQLRTQLGRFGFFRIEGHLGQAVRGAVPFLEGEIRNNNLPFQVRAVALAEDRARVVVKPPARYTDLHRFHYLLRQDLVSQLDDTKRFSGSFKGQVEGALNDVIDEPSERASVRTLVSQKNDVVTSRSTAAGNKLNRGYREYLADMSWRDDVVTTQTAAGELKSNLGRVVKTDFVTPFDSLIGSNQLLWLGWLDDIIKAREDQEDDRLLFGRFLERHPGLEHFAGVPRGGTFVLVYDERGIVVADFMLPYVCCDPVEEEPEEPPLRRPVSKPSFVLEKGANVLPSREKYVQDRLKGFRAEIEPVWKRDVQIQRDYVDVFTDSIRTMGSVFTRPPQQPETVPGREAADPVLDFHMRDVEFNMERLDFLLAEAVKPGANPVAFAPRIREAEAALAAAAGGVTKFVADTNLDVTAGSPGFQAMSAVSEGLSRLHNRTAVNAAKRVLTGAIANPATSAEVKGAITNVLRSRGLGV